MNGHSQLNRLWIYRLSRSVICAVVVLSIGGFFWIPPTSVAYAIDILLRTYLIFLGTVMAHEGIHGLLGPTRATNFWWARVALLPSMVPFTNFRKTHQLHHIHTNIPDKDPDHFIKPRHPLEIPFRAVAMPHQWFFWLWKRGKIQHQDVIELGLNYLGIGVVYSVVASQVGFARVFWGLAPALILVSVLLWVPFAFKTHEGFSTGSAESRSHDYYGRFMYWASLGLSMHRVHHMKPQLAWIELRQFVKQRPRDGGFTLLPQRDTVDASHQGEKR